MAECGVEPYGGALPRESAAGVDAVFVAHAGVDGTLIRAGSVEIGSSAGRERLRTALNERHLRTRGNGHRLAPGVWLDVGSMVRRAGPVATL